MALNITNKYFYYDKGYKDIWFTGYKPITMHATAQGDLVTDSKKADHTWYEVWDEACVTWATFDTFALAKEHAKHLSDQVGLEHVLYWKHCSGEEDYKFK